MADINISTVIMAHPRRAEAATRMRESCPELDLRVIFDPEPDAPPSALRTSVLAWNSVADSATHQLVLQDDLVLCSKFAEQLHAAVAAMPDNPLFLYTDWGTKCSHLLRLGALRGASWVEAVDPWVPAQAVLLPADIADDFVNYVAQRPHLDDDALALAEYLRLYKLNAFVCMPNLVQHQNSPSLLGNDIPMGLRHSTCFGQPEDHSSQWTGAPLEGLTVLPDLLAGRCFYGVRGTDDQGDLWSNIPAHDWLAGRGLSVFDQIAMFREAETQGRQSADALTSVASGTLLFHLWLTGFLLGLIIASWSEADQAWLSAAFERPLARRALATLIPGGLRELVAGPYLTAASAAFLPLVRHAIYQGLEANAELSLLSD